MLKMNNPHENKIIELMNNSASSIDEYGIFEKGEQICHTSYDGFIPFTNGGYQCMVMTDLMSKWSSGSGYAEPIETELNDAIEYSLDSCLVEFIDEHLLKLSEIFNTSNKDKLKQLVDYTSLYDNNKTELAEQLSENESLYLTESSEFWLVLRMAYYSVDNCRNESGKDEINFMAGINTDYTYGRDKGLNITFDKNIPVSDINYSKLPELISDMELSIFD